ncbi:MAG: hypothetical protein ACE361_01005 [Aureliella sp.]
MHHTSTFFKDPVLRVESGFERESAKDGVIATAVFSELSTRTRPTKAALNTGPATRLLTPKQFGSVMSFGTVRLVAITRSTRTRVVGLNETLLEDSCHYHRCHFAALDRNRAV